MQIKTVLCLTLVFGTILIFLNGVGASQQPCANYLCPIHLESLEYPEIARAVRVSGTVVLRLKISPSGKAFSVEVLSGPTILAQEAQRNAKKWVFAPVKLDSIELNYEFRLDKPGTEKEVNPIIKFDLPNHVLVVSRERESIPD